MLFESLLIRNLGVFRGEHSLELLPPHPERPIVLVGALNGSGKTTVIEALQLALYGRRASYGWRGASSYQQYLERVRNRHASRGEPTIAQVKIKLADGRRLRVHREWSYLKGVPKEFIAVYLNDSEHPDPNLSETWDEEVERLLPAQLAELFFFDGERIEQLADPLKSADVLRSAVSSLLGLDLVDHLLEDLEILRSRQKQRALPEGERARIDLLDAEMRALSQRLEDIRDLKASCNTRIAEGKRELERAKVTLQAAGGERFHQREQWAAERAKAAAQIESAERQLRELAAGVLPLKLLEPKLRELSGNGSEGETYVSGESAALVESHFDALRKWITNRKFPAAAERDLRAYISSRLKALRVASRKSGAILSTSLHERVSRLLENQLPSGCATALGLVEKIRADTESMLRLEENLARVPELEQLSDAFGRMGAAEALCKQAESELAGLVSQEGEVIRELEGRKRRKTEQLEKIAEAGDATRTAEYCSRSMETLAKFRSDLVRIRREQLEQLILDSFRVLSRKTDLISAISLDPHTMAVSLKTTHGSEIVTQQLSAGERQLLAIAMLWGLAQATGRPVPVVIDTPLGRLDGEHRRTIVEKYFPDAGHQVILLSTDMEVDAGFSELLDDSVAHRYLIGYDPHARSSSFIPGYFSRQ